MVKPENVLETIVFPMTYGFFLQETPIFDGKAHGLG
jgi:hypothetical protein